MGILSLAFAYGASWKSNLFEILYCLPDHLLSIPLLGFKIFILLIAVHPTVDCTRLVTVCDMET
jgi:hypothetical protein